MMVMRLRVPELLAKKGWTTYALSKKSGGKISMSTAYRLKKSGGVLKFYERDLLILLCDTFDVGPAELWTRDDEAPIAAPSRGKGKRAA